MYRQNEFPPLRSRLKILVGVIIALALIGLAGIFATRQIYNNYLKPVGGSTEQKVVVIEQGASVATIAGQLEGQQLIRKSWAFERYVLVSGMSSKLQAGTYKFNQSQSVPDIARIIAEGKVTVDLLTIVPGYRLDQVRQTFIEASYAPAVVDAALDPAQYADMAVLADKPRDASLEGYLYPNSYQKSTATQPAEIIRQSLEEMDSKLTPDNRAAFARQNLTVHQAVTLASIVEQEVANQSDRAQAAQVFQRRLREDIALASDATAPYGAILAGQQPSLRYESPYNSYTNKGLPPGPISNVTESSLKAVAEPANTDWLYFVSGDDGRTHFSRTAQEHEALTEQYCTKLCGR